MKSLLKAHSLLLVSLLFFPTTSALDKAALRRAIADPDREVTDFSRDEARKPVEVLDFLGLEAGMTVLDLYAAGATTRSFYPRPLATMA